MPRFPSDLPFVSFLKYSPHGASQGSRLSRSVRSAIKNDGLLPPVYRQQAIDYAAARVAEEAQNFPFLRQYLGADATLVPVPRSKPRKGQSLWPALRICERLVHEGLGSSVATLLQRDRPTHKSATATAGKRPAPVQHYDTASVQLPLLPLGSSTVTLVDDFVTRGSTFLGMVARLEESYPQVTIHCFALVRSVGTDEVGSMLEPVLGRVEYDSDSGRLSRSP